MRCRPSQEHFCRHCHTRNHCVAAGLTPDELIDLAKVMNFGQRLAANEHLYAAGDVVNTQYHVRSGMLKSYFINRQGEESVTGFYLPGDVVPNFGAGGRSLQNVIALDASSVCTTSNNGAQASEKVWQAIGSRAHGVAHDAFMHQLTLKAHSAQARFAGFCVQMSQRLGRLGRDPNYISTPMSRTDIASYLGLTLESLSRVVSRMKQSGVIAADRAHIGILKPETLTALAPHLS